MFLNPLCYLDLNPWERWGLYEAHAKTCSDCLNHCIMKQFSENLSTTGGLKHEWKHLLPFTNIGEVWETHLYLCIFIIDCNKNTRELIRIWKSAKGPKRKKKLILRSRLERKTAVPSGRPPTHRREQMREKKMQQQNMFAGRTNLYPDLGVLEDWWQSYFSMGT